MKTTDFCVVGGGIIGLLTARELVMAGASVTVVEAGQCGREASWAGGGIVSPLYPWRYPVPITALTSLAQASYPRLCTQLHTDTGIDPEWQRSGLLLLAIADQQNAITWAADHQREVRLWRNAEIAADQPGLVTDINEAVCFPDVAQVRNPRLMRALRDDVLRRGVVLCEQTVVKGWRFSANSKAILAAQTSTGEIQAGQFIVCSGAWSAELLAHADITLPVTPVRGQMLMFAPHSHPLRRIVLRDGRYLIPRRDGRIICGSTMEHSGFDKQATEDARDILLRSALSIMPSLRDVPVEMQWAGLRPGSPDGIPFIGQVPTRQNLWVNAGHFRNGIVLAPASATLMADLLLNRLPGISAEPYQLAARV